MRRILLIALSLGVLVPLTAARADLAVSIGPTTIPRGDATGAEDITVNNGLFAVAFAVREGLP